MVGGLDTMMKLSPDCQICKKYRCSVLTIHWPEASPQQLIQSCEDALAWVYQNRRQLKIYKTILLWRAIVQGVISVPWLHSMLLEKPMHRRHNYSFILRLTSKVVTHLSMLMARGLVLTSKDLDYVTDYYVTQHNVALDNPLFLPPMAILKTATCLCCLLLDMTYCMMR